MNPWNELFDVIRNCSDPEVIEIFNYAKPQWINKFLLDNLRKNDWNYIEYENLREAEVLGMIENTKLFTGVLSITSCIVLYRSTLFYEPS